MNQLPSGTPMSWFLPDGSILFPGFIVLHSLEDLETSNRMKNKEESSSFQGVIIIKDKGARIQSVTGIESACSWVPVTNWRPRNYADISNLHRTDSRCLEVTCVSSVISSVFSLQEYIHSPNWINFCLFHLHLYIVFFIIYTLLERWNRRNEMLK